MTHSGKDHRTRRKGRWLLLLPVLGLLGGLAFGRSRTPTANLAFINDLHPTLKENYPGGRTKVYRFGQSVEMLKRVLDEHLNPSTSWDSSGYPPSGFYWYRPADWESPLPKLMSEIGFSGAELTIESKKFGDTELTIISGPEVTGP